MLGHWSTGQVRDLSRRGWHREKIVVILVALLVSKEVVLLMVGVRSWAKEINCWFLHWLLDWCYKIEIVWVIFQVRTDILAGPEHVKLRRFFSELFSGLLRRNRKNVILNNWLNQRLALKVRLADNRYTRLGKELIILSLLNKWTCYCWLSRQRWCQIAERIVLIFYISLLLSSDRYLLIC